MKVPRFIKEYASYIIKDLNNSLANDMCKKVISERIEKNISLYESNQGNETARITFTEFERKYLS